MHALGNENQGPRRAPLAATVSAGIVWLALGSSSPAWTQQTEVHGHAEEEDQHEESLVRLTADELEEFGIEVMTAGYDTLEIYVSLPGEVQPNADRLAHIVPRYSGIVSDVRAHLGDTVSKSQVLAIIESDDGLASYELKTLIAGTVISKHITLGEAVSREDEIYVIADLSTVWVDLTVYQKDIARVRVGQKALIYTRQEAHDASGTISYVTPVVDEATRSATARLVLPNSRGTWRPGMFVTARILVDNAEVPLAVPSTALQTLDEQTVVFVQAGDAFRPRPVRIGRSSETVVEILSGLEPGERYVSQGGFTLKAELGKKSLGAGHAH